MSLLEIWKNLVQFFQFILPLISRFNVCRESVTVTQDICNLLIHQVLHPQIQKREKDFISISYYLLKGLWVVAPYFQFKSVMCILDNVTREEYEDMAKPVYYELKWFQRLHYWLLVNYGYILQFNLVRICTNFNLAMSFKFMKLFPVITYYYYGIRNAIVDIGV